MRVIALVSLSLFVFSHPVAIAGQILNTVYSGMVRDRLNVYDLRNELKGWEQKDSSSTTKLEYSCDSVAEFKLMRINNRAGVYISLLNSSGDEYYFDRQKIRMNFGNGLKRIPYVGDSYKVEQLKDGWMLRSYARFLSLADFKDQKELAIIVPLLDKKGDVKCEVRAEYIRNESVEINPEDYMPLSKFEFGVRLGVDVAAAGSTDLVFDDYGYHYSLDLTYFPLSYHGIFMGVAGDEKSRKLNNVLGARLDDRNGTTLRLNQFLLGYKQRRLIYNNYWLAYTLAWQYIGVEDFGIGYGNYRRSVSRMDSVVQRIEVRYLLDPNYLSTTTKFLSLGLNHTTIPTTRIADYKIKGMKLGFFASVNVGW